MEAMWMEPSNPPSTVSFPACILVWRSFNPPPESGILPGDPENHHSHADMSHWLGWYPIYLRGEHPTIHFHLKRTYLEYGLNLTKGQADKLHRTAKKGCPVFIHLFHSNLRGDHNMLLTSRQVTKVLQQGTGGMNLEKNVDQLKENMKNQGDYSPWWPAFHSTSHFGKHRVACFGCCALSGIGSAAINRVIGSGL